ncbi:hypothetical protein LRP88_03552 [Fusarium phalaenopsidis]
MDMPLILAAQNAKSEVVRFFLDEAVPVSPTATKLAAREVDGAVEVFQAFLDHGWDINSFDRIPALQYGSPAPHQCIKDGHTPLDFVAAHATPDTPSVIDLLLSSGALAAHSNALHNALITIHADMNCIAMMMLLLDKGFDVNSLSFTNRPEFQSRNPSTALHWAVRKHSARRGRKNMLARVRWLLDHGADVENALQEVSEGVAVRTAAGRHGIPESTLHGRISGSQSRTISHEHFQKLSAEQEKHLTAWIIAQDDLGFAPSHAQVIDFAGRIARLNGNEEPIGIHWMEGFLRRNEGVRTLRGQRLDSARFNGATIENIQGFFPHLAVPVVKEIKPENRHNMDEMGIMEGLGYNNLVLGRAEKNRTIVQNPGSTDWTTIIECISAVGKALTPLVIYKGKTVQQSWFPEDPHFLDFLKDWDFTCSEKGWTNNHIATLWLKKIFIPQTKPAKEGDKRLLIIDGHGSHITGEFMLEGFWTLAGINREAPDEPHDNIIAEDPKNTAKEGPFAIPLSFQDPYIITRASGFT